MFGTLIGIEYGSPAATLSLLPDLIPGELQLATVTLLTPSGAPLTSASVTGELQPPNGPPESLQLVDDGTGGDITSGDGVYRRELTIQLKQVSTRYRSMLSVRMTRDLS